MIQFSLLRASVPDDVSRIENMMQFYAYDFSEWLPLQFSDSGLYPLRPKEAYFAHPATKAFNIIVDGDTAGFACIDNEDCDVDTAYNLGYFFIARGYRGQGLGMAVIKEILRQFKGRWQIFYINQNDGAARFWTKTIPHLSGSEFTQRQQEIDGCDCTVYKFESL
jgi:predicted acetyltransferase